MITLKDKLYKLDNENFYDAVTAKKIKQRTKVYLKKTKTHLIVYFSCLDNPYVKENKYKTDNSDLFKQEVFEVFIAQGSSDPTDYLEIELNPVGAIFIAQIHNHDLIGSKLKTKKIDKKTSEIYSEVKMYDDYWKGKLSIPLKIINQSKSNNSNGYRVNFYRIISKKSHKNSNWENNSEDSIYSCWKCTYSPEKPKFHRCKYFGNIKFK